MLVLCLYGWQCQSVGWFTTLAKNELLLDGFPVKFGTDDAQSVNPNGFAFHLAPPSG